MLGRDFAAWIFPLGLDEAGSGGGTRARPQPRLAVRQPAG